MEHLPTVEELSITAQIDFIVPLKQLGIITRAVLEGIFTLHNPRRIIIIAPATECDIFHTVIPLWEVGKVEFLSEDDFFASHDVTVEQLLAEYDYQRDGDQREPGWWIQQLIKLGAAFLPDLSETYVVWDGDLIATRRWKLCDHDALTGQIRYFIAILQDKAKSEFNIQQYAASMRGLARFEPLEPQGQGTFVTHHMVFNKTYTRELIEMINSHCDDQHQSWLLTIMASSRTYYRFSEYKTYASFMQHYHPTEFHYHPLKDFGEGGLRFRNANPIIDDILNSYAFTNGGLSYRQVQQYVEKNWKRISKSTTPPAYIQLDHVYGLDASNLNIFVSTTASTSADTTITSLSQEGPEELRRRLALLEEDDDEEEVDDDIPLLSFDEEEEEEVEAINILPKVIIPPAISL